MVRARGHGARRRRVLGRALAATSMAASVLLAPSGPAGAHAPHDDIFAVAFSPTVAEDGIVHTLSRGFLMRSTDTGVTWRRVVDGLTARGALSTLVQAPDDPAVLYAAGPGTGVYRSADAGLRWERVGGLPGEADAAGLFVGPSTDGGPGPVVAAAVGGGLLRSDDGGRSWTDVGDVDDPVAGVAFAADGRRVWAVDHAGTLHTSTDGGRTWIAQRLPDVAHAHAVHALDGGEADPPVLVGVDGGRVLAVASDGSITEGGEGLPDEPVVGLASAGPDDAPLLLATTAGAGVHRSDDGGRTWVAAGDGLTTDAQRDEPEYADRPSFGPIAVAEVDDGETVALVGGFDGLFRSTDGAETWAEVVTIPATTVVGLALSPTFAEDGTLMVTTYLNGAHISHDAGGTWAPSHDGLEEPGQYDDGPDRFARLYGAAFSPAYADDGTIFLTRPRTLLRSVDRGRTWTALDVPGTDPSDGALHFVLLAPEPGVVVMGDAKSGRVHRSEDGGRSLTTVGEVGSPVLSMAVDPTDPDVLHAGTRAGVATSRDGGATWEPPAPGQGWAVTTVAVGGGVEPAVLLAGTPRGLRASDDGGRTWRAVPLGPADDEPVEGVVTSPSFADDGTVLVSVRGRGLFRSTDRGRTFTPVAADLGPEQRIPSSYSKPTGPPIAFSPTFATDRTVVASIGSEVLLSTDAGDTWTATAVHAASHPPVEVDPAEDAGGWGRRRVAAVVGAAGLLAVGLAGVIVLGRRRRRRGDVPEGEVPSPGT